MKYFLILIIGFFILISKPQYLPTCNLTTALQDIPPRLFQMTTADGPTQNPLITRFFHNKLGILLSGSAKCYFNFFDFNIIAQNVIYFGFFGWVYTAYGIFVSKKWIPIAVFLLLPLAPFLTHFSNIIYLHKIFAIIGFVLIARRSS